MYSIVTNFKIVNFFKSSKYFKINLGLSPTIVGRSGDRTLNPNDKFSFYYNTQYNTIIYAQGHIGDIMFYLDHYLKEDLLAVYINNEEFIFKFDYLLMRDKGPDFYLGKILKELKEQHEERVKQAEENKIESEKYSPDPEKIKLNPGNVKYEDIQAFLEKKRGERFDI